MVPATSSIHFRDRFPTRYGAPVTIDYNDIDANAGILSSQLAGGSGQSALDTGTANAYAIAPTPAITAYAAGQKFSFIALNTNTGASTLAVNGLAAKAIDIGGTTALSANAILAGGFYSVYYDGTEFQLLNPSTTQASTITHATITLSTAQLVAMYATPVQLIAAPGSGKNVIVFNAIYRVIYNTTALGAGGSVYIQYGNTVHGGGTNALTATVDSSGTLTSGSASANEYGVGAAQSSGVVANTGVFISCSTAFTSSSADTTAQVDIWYAIA